MTSGFSMQAMTRSVPPHVGQVSMSMAKTRFGRCVQVMGARGLSGFSLRGLRFGTTDSRCLQFGANTPWNRVRFNRGRGTSVAGRAMKSSGSRDDVGGAVAKRLLEPIDDLSPIVGREPLVADGGPCDVATELFELVALGGFTAGGGVERKARPLGEQGGWEGFGLYRDGAQGQCLPVGVGPDGDPEWITTASATRSESR